MIVGLVVFIHTIFSLFLTTKMIWVKKLSTNLENETTLKLKLVVTTK